MDWYLHRQVIGQLGPLLIVASIPWLLAAYFYLDPLVTLGVSPAAKASWGELPHAGYLRATQNAGLSLSGITLGSYFAFYWRARRGERFSSTPWPMYVLVLGGLIAGASVYLVLRYLPPA